MDKKQLIFIVLAVIIIIGLALCYTKQAKNQPVKNDNQGRVGTMTQMEEEIISGIKKDYPYLETLEKENNSVLLIKTETAEGDFAIGRYSLSEEKLGSSGTWFAQKNSSGWEVFNTGYSYYGSCQKFWQHDFPKDLTPDCWDEEKNILVETSNPSRFFNDGFTVKDKEAIKVAFIKYLSAEGQEYASSYKNKPLFVSVDSNTQDHMKGRVFIGGIENHSTPAILAAKVGGIWKVIYQGQDLPECKTIDPYSFPANIVPSCYIPDENNKGAFVERQR